MCGSSSITTTVPACCAVTVPSLALRDDGNQRKRAIPYRILIFPEHKPDRVIPT